MSEHPYKKDPRKQGGGPLRHPFEMAEMALKNFYYRYPMFFKGGKLRLFTPVYYPIATLELELLENTGEEFDTIELTVLLLYQAGLMQPEEICDVMGLPINYTTRILEILHGYGHILGNTLTELGILSAESGINYKQYLIRQRVQADTISGLFMSREMIQSESSLVSPTQTQMTYPMIRPNAHLSTDALKQLEQVIERYKVRKDESIFNVNLEKVTQILEIKIEYAYGFLVEFDHLPHPFVILQCRERVNKEVRNYWKPTALSQEVLKYIGNSLDEMEGIDENSFETLVQLSTNLKHALDEQLKRADFKRKLGQQMVKHFGRKVSYKFDGCALNVGMDDDLLDPFSWDLLQSIEAISYCRQGLPHLPKMQNQLLPSTLCYIHSDNPKLVELSEVIVQLNQSRPRLKLYTYIKEQLGEEMEIVTVDRLLSIVEQLSQPVGSDPKTG
jgi:hypothetical protein